MSNSFNFLADENLDYDNLPYRPDGALSLSKHYRWSHLPIIAPNSAEAINCSEDGEYIGGIHRERVYSIVIPIASNALYQSETFKSLVTMLRDSKFGTAIDWSLLERRRHLIHCTIVGILTSGSPPKFAQEVLSNIKQISPFAFKLQGATILRDFGRIYLKGYPELRGEENPISSVQEVFGRVPKKCYLAGIFNFSRSLDLEESNELLSIIEIYQKVNFHTEHVTSLNVVGTKDDLTLDSCVAAEISLKSLG